MNKFIVGATVVVLLLVLFASAYAFSTSLRTLRLNASGLTPSAASEISAPMTYADESQIGAPQADMVRFQTIQEPERLCQSDRATESTVGFWFFARQNNTLQFTPGGRASEYCFAARVRRDFFIMTTAKQIRLTSYAGCAGWASKLGAAELAQVLRPLAGIFSTPDFLQSETARNLLVGLDAPDDAAVYKITDDRAIIQTMDFFPPVVDDAYAFGAIAAANAMSDIYAMGGEVLFGLNIAAWREDLPLDLLTEIFRGGAEKMREGGGAIAGGHTITDKEPKYGIAVTGMVNPREIFTKGGARAGDVLILTKPLGTGILTTAGKNGNAPDDELQNAMRWMMTLNREAARAAQRVGIHAATDITGFALLGHAFEMASASRVQFVMELEKLPVLESAFALALQGNTPGGTARNRDYLQDKVFLPEDLTDAWDAVLFDPQTSGGLLFAIAPEKTDALLRELKTHNAAHWVIGHVTAGFGVRAI